MFLVPFYRWAYWGLISIVNVIQVEFKSKSGCPEDFSLNHYGIQTAPDFLFDFHHFYSPGLLDYLIEQHFPKVFSHSLACWFSLLDLLHSGSNEAKQDHKTMSSIYKYLSASATFPSLPPFRMPFIVGDGEEPK